MNSQLLKILLMGCIGTFFLTAKGPLSAQQAGLKFDSKPMKKNYKELILQAQKLYGEGAFPEALLRLEEASRMRNKISPGLRYRMACLYYLLKQEEKVISLLETKTTLKKFPETHLLLALSYKDLGQYYLAENHLLRYLESKRNPRRQEAALELADVYFLQEKFDRSESLLQQLIDEKPQEEYQLALAKTLIWKGDFQRAEKILRENRFEKENLALYAHLMGEIAFNRGEYEKAIELFQEARSSPNKRFDHLKSKISEKQILCHLFLADEWSSCPESRLWHLIQSRDPLLELARSPNPPLLPLAHYHISAFNLLGDPVSIRYANTLLEQAEQAESPKERPKTLYLLAQMALSDEERERITQELTSEDIHNPYVLRGWYLRGLRDLQHGKQYHSPKDLNRACFAFENIWKNCWEENRHLAVMAVQAQIEAYITENTKKSLKKALSLLDRILTRPDWETCPSKGELFYLQGLAAFKAGQLLEKESHLLLAENSFQEAINENSKPSSSYALFALGVIYTYREKWAEAEKKLLKLYEDDPGHPLSAEALFTASKCREKLNQDTSALLKVIYEDYPESPFAAEAYLSYYPYQEYIKGNEEALGHLSALPQIFPKSPWSIEAYYLIGLDRKRDLHSSSGKLLRSKDLASSIKAFKKALKLYKQLESENLLGEDPDYFFAISSRASIERALADLEVAENAQGTKRQIYLEYAKELLLGLIHDLQQPPYLFQNDPYLSMLEECEFTLATTYEKMGRDDEAQKVLLSMNRRFQDSVTTRGYYLSRMQYELGVIEKRSGKHQTALEYFKKAEDAAKGNILNSDQRLDIWIQQSLCLLDGGEPEQAMGILSQVINQDVASSQRLKAMYLRSEIYEQQGREELAVRQLEALSKQQGEWAAKAKEKLQAYDY